MDNITERMLLLKPFEHYYYKHKMILMNKLGIDKSLLFTSDIISNIGFNDLYNADYHPTTTMYQRYSPINISYFYFAHASVDDNVRVNYYMNRYDGFIFHFSNVNRDYTNIEPISMMYRIIYNNILTDLFSYSPIIITNQITDNIDNGDIFRYE